MTVRHPSDTRSLLAGDLRAPNVSNKARRHRITKRAAQRRKEAGPGGPSQNPKTFWRYSGGGHMHFGSQSYRARLHATFWEHVGHSSSSNSKIMKADTTTTTTETRSTPSTPINPTPSAISHAHPTAWDTHDMAEGGGVEIAHPPTLASTTPTPSCVSHVSHAFAHLYGYARNPLYFSQGLTNTWDTWDMAEGVGVKQGRIYPDSGAVCHIGYLEAAWDITGNSCEVGA